MRIAKSIVHRFGKWYIRDRCRREFEDQRFYRINERPIEYRFVFQVLGRLRPCAVLDVGTGTTALPALMASCGCQVTASDNIVDYWPRGMLNPHYHIVQDNITHTSLAEQYDLATCISVLEHIDDHAGAVRGMFSRLRPGGSLLITCPYSEREYVKNAYDFAESYAHGKTEYGCQIYSRREVDGWLAENDGEMVEQEFWEVLTGDYWSCGEFLNPPRQVTSEDKHHHTCMWLRKRQKS